MSDTVWISTAMGHASNQRPMTHSHTVDEKSIELARDCRRRNEEGEKLGQECFPEEVFGSLNATEADYNLPDLFFAGSYWVVSASAAKVLSEFNLGGGGFYQVNVFKSDRKTAIGDGWFCINFGNQKSVTQPSDSPRMMQDYIRNGVKGWFPPFVTKDGDVAVSADAFVGPDIWIDPQIGRSFFISGDAVRALKKAKADRGFFLSKCRVVDSK